MDATSKRHIISVENDARIVYDTMGELFTRQLSNMYEKDGEITRDDFISVIGTFLEKAVDTIVTSFGKTVARLHASAKHSARKKLGLHKKATLIKVAAYDDYLQKALEQSFTKVKSLPDEIVGVIKDKLLGTTQIDTSDILREMIGESELDLKSRVMQPGFSSADLREGLRYIWGKYRYNIERILRTESMGAHTAAQLREWYDQGIREVTRIYINDNRTCEICKQVGKPGNRWLIADLLKLKNPLIEDPNNPGELLTHPSCRDSFEPILDVTKMDMLYFELTGQIPDYKAAATVRTKQAEVANVPYEYQTPVSNMLNEIESLDNKVEFTPDITTNENWLKQQRAVLAETYPPEEIEKRLQNVVDLNKRELMQYTDEEGNVYINGMDGTIVHPAHIIGRIKGQQVWAKISESDKGYVKQQYARKKQEEGYTLEDEGIEVFGGYNFATQLSAESPELYFAESYGLYLSNPVMLRMFDESMYAYLKENHFTKDYYERGGIK